MERCRSNVHQAMMPAPFLTKTYHLVEDQSTDDIISWGSEFSTFVVWKPVEFSKDLLPLCFKHNNFSSFVRQLNTYGFKKVSANRWEFANDFFRKGSSHLLSRIQRRKTAGMLSSSAGSNSAFEKICSSSPSSSGEEMPNIAQQESECLASENDRLREENSILVEELSKMHQLYADAMNFIQQQPPAAMSPMPPIWFGAPFPYGLPDSSNVMPEDPESQFLGNTHAGRDSHVRGGKVTKPLARSIEIGKRLEFHDDCAPSESFRDSASSEEYPSRGSNFSCFKKLKMDSCENPGNKILI